MRMTMKKMTALSAAAAFGLLTLTASGEAQDLKQINVLLPNENTTVFYPIIIANGLGFFEEEGVKVNLLASETTIPYVAFLSNGQTDVAMLDAPQTLQAANAGVPISVVYEAHQYAPEVVAVSEDSPIKDITELKGTTVGLASDRDRITLQVALDAAGASIDDVKTVVVGDAGPTLANAFKNQTVSAVAAAINDLATLAGIGIHVRDITPEGVSDNPANTFVIFKPRTEELREALTGFLRGWARGAAVADLAPDVAAALAQRSATEEWESVEAGQSLFKVAQRLNKSHTDAYGDLQPEIWKKVQGPLVKFGELEKEIDPSMFLDDSFIGPANDFDKEAVARAAEEWKQKNM